MKGAAAIVFAAAFTSCSKTSELYDEGRAEQQKEATVNEKYAAAFEKAFDTVGPNVDWGFGRKSSSTRAFTRAVGDYAQYKGNIQPTNITFPSDCDASNFLAKVPEDAKELPEGGGGLGSYLVEGSYDVVTTWAGASKIYVKGTVDLSAGDTDPAKPRFAPDYRSEIFLLEGATLKLGRVSAQNFKCT